MNSEGEAGAGGQCGIKGVVKNRSTWVNRPPSSGGWEGEGGERVRIPSIKNVGDSRQADDVSPRERDHLRGERGGDAAGMPGKERQRVSHGL